MAVVILDYDGTLHECLVIYAPAIRHAFEVAARAGHTEYRELSDDEIKQWIGFPVTQGIWETLLPDTSREFKDSCITLVAEEMVRLILGGKACLYPHTIEVLEELRDAGHTLIFLSNCRRSYMDAHITFFGLEQYFAGFYCAEDYDNAPKYRVFESVLADFPQFSPDEYLVVGDRHKDMELAALQGLVSIGCTYGYGSEEELRDATRLCHSVQDLPSHVRALVG